MPGSTAQTNKIHTFYLQQRTENGLTWADIKVNHPLDYETIREYNLTIRVEVPIPFFFFPLSRWISYVFNSVFYCLLFFFFFVCVSRRTTELNNSRPKRPCSSCWKTLTTRYRCLPNGNKRPFWKANRSAPRSLRWTPSTKTARSRITG